MIEGRDETHPEGSYFLEFWDQGKQAGGGRTRCVRRR